MERNCKRFEDKFVKTIKDVNGRFDDYSISPKVRQISLHWGYELVGNDLLWFIYLFIENWVFSKKSKR